MDVLTKKSGIITTVVCWLLTGMLSFQSKAQTGKNWLPAFCKRINIPNVNIKMPLSEQQPEVDKWNLPTRLN